LSERKLLHYDTHGVWICVEMGDEKFDFESFIKFMKFLKLLKSNIEVELFVINEQVV